jgi:hypothetical protein
VIVWLNKHGYDIIGLPADKGRASLPGKRGAPMKTPNPPDIYAKRRGQNFYYYIESKGDPPSTQALSNVIGELTRHMVAKTPARYAFAVPKSYCSVISRYLKYESWKKLGVYILLVGDDSRVTQLNPSKQNHKLLCDMA